MHYGLKDFLEGKSRILLTSNLKFLNLVDTIIYIENGQIIKTGPSNEIL